MFSKLRVHHLRAIGPDPIEIALAPISVLVGRNGSGKSSMLEALALTAQSATEDLARRDLVLDGSKIKLAPAPDDSPSALPKRLLFRKDPTLDVAVGLEWRLRGDDPVDAALSRAVGTTRRRPPQTVGYQWTRCQRGPWTTWRHRFDLDGESICEAALEVEPKGATGAQVAKLLRFPRAKVSLDVSAAPFHLERVLDVDFLNATSLGAPSASRTKVEPVIAALEETVRFLRERLASVGTLWSLRNRRLSLKDIGPEVRFVGPYAAEATRLLALTNQKPEFQALRRWAEKFGMPGLEAGWAGDKQLRAAFRDPHTGTVLDIDSAADGANQCLVLAAQLLLSPAGSTLLIEEPENGLHPALERLLPALFAAAVRSGHQVIVTTHSEVLVASLGNAVRNSTDGLRPDDVIVHEIERDKGGARARAITISDKGYLSEWVRSYAEEAEERAEEWARALPQERSTPGARRARPPGGRSPATR